MVSSCWRGLVLSVLPGTTHMLSSTALLFVSVSGSEDGTVYFFDIVRKICVNKLQVRCHGDPHARAFLKKGKDLKCAAISVSLSLFATSKISLNRPLLFISRLSFPGAHGSSDICVVQPRRVSSGKCLHRRNSDCVEQAQGDGASIAFCDTSTCVVLYLFVSFSSCITKEKSTKNQKKNTSQLNAPLYLFSLRIAAVLRTLRITIKRKHLGLLLRVLGLLCPVAVRIPLALLSRNIRDPFIQQQNAVCRSL